MKTSSITPFLGPVTAADPRNIPGTSAQDALNVRMDDGALRLRYGFKNLLAAVANFSDFRGAQYLQGYSGTTLTEEYIVFMKVSGVVKPYYVALDSTTGAVSAYAVITDGVNALTLNDSEWVAVAYEANAYFINPSHTPSVHRHVIETANSCLPLVAPTAPATPLTFQVLYGGSSTPYSTRKWTGLNTARVTYTGQGNSTGYAVNADGSLTFGNTTAGAGSVIIDMKTDLTNQDWTSNDCYFFTWGGEPGAGNGSMAFDISKFVVSYVNDDGSPATFVPFNVYATVISPQVGTNPALYGIRIEFDKADRALWDNIRKVLIEYSCINGSGSKIRLSPITLGGVWMSYARNQGHNLANLRFTYSYYNSTGTFESGLNTVPLFIPYSILEGLSPAPGYMGLGVHLRFTFTVSADATVDNYRFYVQDQLGPVWRRVATFTDAGATYDLKLSYTEMHALTMYTNITPFKTDGCVNAFAFKGWMIWLYNTAIANVRHSRIGDAEKQESVLDQDDDLSRGESFTLADNLADVPLFGCQAGDTAFIAGSHAIYAQSGDYPCLMTPCKMLAESTGAAGKFAGCAWKDDSGNPGIAWMSPQGQIYFMPSNPQYLGDNGARPEHISESIQTGVNSPAEFLRDGQSLTDFSTCRFGVDGATSTLYVIMGSRALVFRKNANGDRYWEPYSWSNASWSYLAFSSRWRMRVCRSTGEFDELEWNTATGAYIVGANRDAGNPVPTPFWKSKWFRGVQNRRVFQVRAVRNSLNDRPYITVFSERTPEGNMYQFDTGSQKVRTGITNQGREIAYKVSLPDSDCAISLLEVAEGVTGRPNF